MKNLSIKNKGFTLIEVLLVVVLLSAIAAMGIRLARQHLQNEQIDKAANQMQSWLEAGMAYYVGQGEWPTQTKDISDKNYMPQPSNTDDPGDPDTSPWGNHYHVTKKQKEDGTDFGIYLKMNSKQLAEQLASKLPAATITDTDKVTAYVPIPGQASDQANNGIKVLEIVNKSISDDGIFVFRPTTCGSNQHNPVSNSYCCPTNWTPGISVALKKIETPSNPWTGQLYFDYSEAEVSNIGSYWHVSLDTKSKNSSDHRNSHDGSVAYTVYCEPPSSSSTEKQPPNAVAKY